MSGTGATPNNARNVEVKNDIGNPITVDGTLDVTDGGGSLTVDGTVTIQDGGNVISVDDAGGSLTIDGNTGQLPVTINTVTMQNAATATGNGTTLNTDGFSTSVLEVTGTFSGTITFEASNDGGTTWFSISAVQVGTNNISITATTTGLYRISSAGVKLLRARISAYTSGSITVKGGSIVNATAPKVVALSGSTVVSASTAPVASGGVSTFRSLTASNTGEVIKASPGQVYGYHFGNQGGGEIFVKLYNKSTAPTSADTPFMSFMVGRQKSVDMYADAGIPFSNGISVRATNAKADADTASPPANDLVVNVLYF